MTKQDKKAPILLTEIETNQVGQLKAPGVPAWTVNNSNASTLDVPGHILD